MFLSLGSWLPLMWARVGDLEIVGFAFLLVLMDNLNFIFLYNLNIQIKFHSKQILFIV